MIGPLAHGIGGVRDLPVPEWLFLWGAGVVLVVSFAALGALWRSPLLERHARGRPWGPQLGSALPLALRVLVQAISASLLVLVLVAAFAGSTNPGRNLAPTWIYVVFWLGLPALSVVLGDVWRVLSPWRALADGYVWVAERVGREARPLAVYPHGLGRWPAAAALLAFAALELAYWDPASPRALGFAALLYTYVTLFGMAAFGRETWSERGEGFAVLFSYFARLAPLGLRAGRLAVRPPFAPLAGREPVPGSLAFLAVALGSVGYDGFSRTRWWQDLVASVEAPFVVDRPGLGELVTGLVSLGGLLAFVGVVAGAYLLAVRSARSLVAAPRSLEPDFLLSLVPIAFVYMLAHYLTLFLVQGQFAIPLLSDPLGRGWDVLGTVDYGVSLAPLAPNTVWYVQAGALVAGHVAGLAIAHDRAVAVFRDRGAALRSQYAMLALMVVYTVGGLWLLSRG